MDKQALRIIQFVDTYFPMIDGVVVTVHNYAALMNREGKTAVIFPQQKKKPGAYAGLGYETVQVKRSGFSFVIDGAPDNFKSLIEKIFAHD